jgi:RNA polymerase sigma factor (sigma-70 family)
MATASFGGSMRKAFDRVREADSGDGELLTRYRNERDQDAFGSLVRRHGPMVLGVCRRVLRDYHAAADAFQATFLVLAKKADAVRPPDRLAPWLYGVAYRTALKARGRAFRRQQVEQHYASHAAIKSNGNEPSASHAVDADADGTAELLPLIDEHLNALPEKYRTALVLCGIQGLNKAVVAAKLGLPEGTVSSRLARAREMLRDRLLRRGIAVPAVTFTAIFTVDSLQAAVPPALATSASAVAGTSAISATILALSNEVIRSMAFLKLKILGAIALAVSLVGSGYGLVALQADDKKPQTVPGEVKKAQPASGEAKKPVPADDEKPKVAKGEKDEDKGEKSEKGEKPQKPQKPEAEDKKPTGKFGGKVEAVDAKANTITLVFKGEGGVTEKVVKVASSAKVFIDGKEGKIADVPKGAMANFVLPGSKEGAATEATEVRVIGQSFVGVVKQVDASGITLDGEKKPQAFTLTADTKVTVNGKDAKVTDLGAGDKVLVVLTADSASVLGITSGKAEGEKPGVKVGKFGGMVSGVDAKAQTISIHGKGENNDIVVKLIASAKITVDGKEAKFGDIGKGMIANFVLSSGKDQPREASEVHVTGTNFNGSIKQLDDKSITISNEKAEKVLKLLPNMKVIISGKDAKLADLKVGEKVSVTLSADESGVLQIVGGAKPTGEKPKPEKRESEDE